MCRGNDMMYRICYQEIVIICKSSGLNMLTQWLEDLVEENLPIKLRVIALGPVSRRLLNRKDIDLLVIKGRKDIYSRFLDGHPADVMVDSNHFCRCRHCRSV